MSRRDHREPTFRDALSESVGLVVAGKPVSDDRGIERCVADLETMLNGELSVLRKLDSATNANAAIVIERLTPVFFWEKCAIAALTHLPAHLASLCTDIEAGFDAPEGWSEGVWFFEGLIDALLEMMGRHATQERSAVAPTNISEMIGERFEFSLEMQANVLLVGDSRLGKTVSLEANCRARPGACRRVVVPAGNRRHDFLNAHAEALYLTYDKRPTSARLEDDLKHVLLHCGLLIAYDEFHAAIPDKSDRERAPWRLNWIRGSVVDRNLGVIFSATRQKYSQALKLFLNKTRWAIEQHAGRLHDVVTFGVDRDDTEAPPVFSSQDILKIAAVKFPDIAEEVREKIAIAAQETTSPAQSIEALAKSAKWKARKAGRTSPTAIDAKEAIAELKSRTSHEAIEQGAPRAGTIKRGSSEPDSATGQRRRRVRLHPARPLHP